MNPRRLFVASCIALITSAFSFMIRGDILDSVKGSFGFTNEMVGTVAGAAFLGMALAMLIFSALCDFLGMGKVLLLAWLCHLCGILGTIFCQELAQQGFVISTFNSVVGILPGWMQLAAADKTVFWVLWLSTFLVGAGNGLVEIAINPLAATLFPTEKTHYLNILHAWWPGGLIMSGLLATFAVGNEPIRGIEAWRIKMGLLLVPLLIYGLMAVGQKFPDTERVAAKISTGQMFMQALRPMFLIWAVCMLLTASTELAPNQWQNSVLTRTANVSGTLVFVYTSGLMFVMRFFAGPLAHKLSPVGMLTCSALLSGLGLFWLSYVANAWMAFTAATVFGVGIAYFWPTMLGVTAERFPKGGALLMGLMGSIGNLAIWQALPQMGAIYDSYTVNAMSQELRDTKIVDEKGQPIKDEKGNPLTLVDDKFTTWLPRVVTEHIHPAGSARLNPEALQWLAETRKLKEDVKKDKKELTEAQKYRVEEAEKIENALKEPEKIGASWAFRWVAVLPCFLVVIFGLIAITDALRGGYKKIIEKEHLGDRTADGSVAKKAPTVTASDYSRS